MAAGEGVVSRWQDKRGGRFWKRWVIGSRKCRARNKRKNRRKPHMKKRTNQAQKPRTQSRAILMHSSMAMLMLVSLMFPRQQTRRHRRRIQHLLEILLDQIAAIIARPVLVPRAHHARPAVTRRLRVALLRRAFTPRAAAGGADAAGDGGRALAGRAVVVGVGIGGAGAVLEKGIRGGAGAAPGHGAGAHAGFKAAWIFVAVHADGVDTDLFVSGVGLRASFARGVEVDGAAGFLAAGAADHGV